MGGKIQERIKCRSRVRIQQCIAQCRLADLACAQAKAGLVPCVAETELPVPTLKVIAKFAQLTAQANIEEIIVIRKPCTSGPAIVNRPESNASGHRDWDTVVYQSRVPHRKRIKWIRDRHTDADRAKRCAVRVFEWIRCKRHSREGRIEERPDNFKVRKKDKVFVAYVAHERSVEALSFRRRERWRNCCEVIGEVVATSLIIRTNLWPEFRCVGRRVRNRRVHTRRGRPVRAEKHTREQAEVANATGEKPAALIESSKGNKESIGRNVTVRAEETTGALPKIGDNNNICLVISS